ncbi:MAG: bifunctional diaminohydroxyphosphoribosylaminopyrimidine deaminase/5-amino-6-(5-phosphoribosylamino)uracil reductase RibD [Actinomycetia bacterium]|nr:bifunctional diaminohydroxyphosphoribosylaminopyrimidine deaminase/5-amino-6-(5-phosphoribosylamino)uracil reductase RibD [Actinomycetes bacterium]
MRIAIDAASTSRLISPPNPWVGAVVHTADDERFVGSTRPPGGNHAEIEALIAAGNRARGATIYTTLEPCSHDGRTGPCADALIDAGVGRVVVGIADPDPQVAGRGIGRLRAADIEVEVGVEAQAVSRQLRPYLHHRRTGRPWVVLKLAASLDGRTAAPDGSSQWITGPEARTDTHRLRAESGAIVVGAGTVRADDPALTVRHVEASEPGIDLDPVRVVLGTASPTARVHPAIEHQGSLGHLLDRLGAEGIVQVMVEGGAAVAASFHAQDLVDQYVIYLAPVLFGGDDARGLFVGPAAPTIDEVWRGRIEATTQLGVDLRVDLVPTSGQPEC